MAVGSKILELGGMYGVEIRNLGKQGIYAWAWKGESAEETPLAHANVCLARGNKWRSLMPAW